MNGQRVAIDFVSSLFDHKLKWQHYLGWCSIDLRYGRQHGIMTLWRDFSDFNLAGREVTALKVKNDFRRRKTQTQNVERII